MKRRVTPSAITSERTVSAGNGSGASGGPERRPAQAPAPNRKARISRFERVALLLLLRRSGLQQRSMQDEISHTEVDHQTGDVNERRNEWRRRTRRVEAHALEQEGEHRSGQ